MVGKAREGCLRGGIVRIGRVRCARAARALLRARFAAPKVDLDDIVEDVGGVVCGLLCVVAFRWACDLWSSEVFSVLGCQ